MLRALFLIAVPCVSGSDVQRRELKPLPAPPPVIVAGSRIGFTRDSETGQINVHFMEGFHPDHVAVLQQQKPLGTVFFTGGRTRVTADDLKLLHDVGMTGLVLWDMPVTDKDLEALKGHAHLESISLSRTKITDACVETFGSWPKLARISIDYGEITDQAVAKIAELRQLKNVNFFRCPKITDDGVMQLTRLGSLERLFLNDNEQLTRRIVRPLVALKNLNRIELDSIMITAEDAGELARLVKLETLGLSRSGFDDKAAVQLSRMASLKSLVVQSTAITDAGVIALAKSTGLRALGLSKNTITDQGVAALADLPELESLGLSSTKVTDQGVAALQKLNKLKRLTLDGTAVTGKSIPVFDGLAGLEVLFLNGTSVTTVEIEALCERHPTLTVFPTPRSVLLRKARENRKP